MKQNEKILVVAVTGFLVVILVVAILFGKDGTRRPPQDTGSAGAGTPSGTAGGTDATLGLEELLDRMSGKQRTGTEPGTSTEPANGADGEAQEPAMGAVGDRPLLANVTLPPPTPASMVTERLGISRSERGYRYVRARPGDTLAGLVQTWCGSLDGHLDVARAINEELDVLKVGQEVCLPWVEDEVLLAAWEARHGAGAVRAPRTADAPASTPAVPAAQPAPGAAPASGSARDAVVTTAGSRVPSRSYTMKAGDTLWKIGEREVGARAVPQFLREVRELNPGLDVDRLREGQQILLPARS